jgi:hypothetical protein
MKRYFIERGRSRLPKSQRENPDPIKLHHKSIDAWHEWHSGKVCDWWDDIMARLPFKEICLLGDTIWDLMQETEIEWWGHPSLVDYAPIGHELSITAFWTQEMRANQIAYALAVLWRLETERFITPPALEDVRLFLSNPNDLVSDLPLFTDLPLDTDAESRYNVDT